MCICIEREIVRHSDSQLADPSLADGPQRRGRQHTSVCEKNIFPEHKSHQNASF